MPRMPTAPMLTRSSTGAVTDTPAMLPTATDGISTLSATAGPVMVVSRTRDAGARPRCCASSRATTVRSAPVSTMNGNGPAPAIVTGTDRR